MPTGLHLPYTTLLGNLLLAMRREEPLVFIQIPSAEVWRLIIVRRVIVVEQLERCITAL